MAPESNLVAAPLRGLNKDAPLHLLRSGESPDCLNVNLVNHGGAIGRRGEFKKEVSTSTQVGKIQWIKEWVHEKTGDYRVIYKVLGKDKIYAWKPSDNSIIELGACSTTETGSLFVFGTDIYYMDTAKKWSYLYNSSSSSYTHYSAWGITSPTTSSITATYTPGTAGAVDPGVYRYCAVPYDSRRNIEGQRGAFTEPVVVTPVAYGGGEYDRPAYVKDDTVAAGYRHVDVGSLATPSFQTGKVELTGISVSGATGRYDKLRIYRTAPNTDFTDRAASDPKSSFSQMAVLIGEIPVGTTTFDDVKGALDCDWDNDQLLQAAGEPSNCPMALLYGNSIFFLSPSNMPGGYERSVPGKLIQVAKQFTVTEATVPLLRSPHVPYGGGVCPVPAIFTAAIDHQGQTLLFSRSSIYRFSGSDRSPYVSELASGFGAAGGWAIAKTPFGLIFWDGASLIRLSGGTAEPFQTKGVDSILNSIPADKADDVCVGYCTRTKELLVAFKTSSTQRVLAFDFQRSSWFEYRTAFSIYGFFEANIPGKGKMMVAVSSDGLRSYPNASGDEVWGAASTSYQTVFGTESLDTMKTITSMYVSIGSEPIKITTTGYWSGDDTAKKVEKTATLSEIKNTSIELQEFGRAQLHNRFFKFKVEPIDYTKDWSLTDIDILEFDQRKVKP
jgi:hypothetical protein